tara:strand:+ start:656 stop:790 length:135 start_codon:yes stop_codon:yes gene_type:complete
LDVVKKLPVLFNGKTSAIKIKMNGVIVSDSTNLVLKKYFLTNVA